MSGFYTGREVFFTQKAPSESVTPTVAFICQLTPSVVQVPTNISKLSPARRQSLVLIFCKFG